MQMEKLCVEIWSSCSLSTVAAAWPGTGVMSTATKIEALEDVWSMIRDETSCKCAILFLVAEAMGSSEGVKTGAIGSLFSVFSDAVHINQEHPSLVLLRLHNS